jgi:HlyD family secretion protein
MITKRALVAAVIVIAMVAVAYGFLVPRTVEVVTITARFAPSERILAVNGRIRPRLQVDIRPSVGGELTALPFDVGDSVENGQVLARIDDAPELAAIAEAEASVRTQEATLAQARRDFRRFEALGEFVSRRDLEQRRLAVVEGERELNRRQAGVTQVRELRERRVLRAPFAGVILERLVDPGQTVGLESIIYRLANLSRPEVTAEIDEIYAAEVRPGMEARVSLPGEDRQLRAVVSHVEPRVDPATGARDVRLELIDEAVNAPSGLTVTVNLLIERRSSAISVPRSAIVQSGNRATVRIVDEGGEVIERPIRFLDWPAEEVIVTSGLKAGERIMVDPDSAAPGDKVAVAD